MPDATNSEKHLPDITPAQNSNEDEGRDVHREQLAIDLESESPLGWDESCEEELKKLEDEKVKIYLESKRLVQNEMWYGLGLLSLCTALVFRLTFWDLSWGIMEPICFFLGSAYCLFGYLFFLKTSRVLTLESYFAARLQMKQEKLMKISNFDSERYIELQRSRLLAVKID